MNGHGFRLLPLRPGTNIPAIRNWQNLATDDHDQIFAWRQEFPGCNWGVRTGDGLGVLDLDTKNDEHGFGGFDSLIDVQEHYGVDLSNLPVVQTASGAHLYFRYDGHLPSKVPWLPHLDVKADGGHQVAGPGTRREVNGVGRVYEVIRGDLAKGLRGVPFAPPELIEAIRNTRGSRRSGTGRGSPSAGADLPSTEDAIRDGLPMGARDDFMHRLACRWWSKLGLDAHAEVYALGLTVWSETPDHDSFPWSQAEKCLMSAHRFVSAETASNLAVIDAWLHASNEGGRG
ncbi:bifunctional DNA primase/polymerase [Agromyces seonyuensis]|uniref:DNA primase/polymerase bifunctional N-terminal domain-containing protein n=1 Tax=Agromyces seonyuensis TaxID=2662446 RepID=A0A6I4NVH2_9MICO|nr:bifunctional DNA primase/polymerase [Agromyces seonyuensis]MWB98310.1 hypothetical protein [Agromyces seonyuensis]